MLADKQDFEDMLGGSTPGLRPPAPCYRQLDGSQLLKSSEGPPSYTPTKAWPLSAWLFLVDLGGGKCKMSIVGDCFFGLFSSIILQEKFFYKAKIINLIS